MKRILVIADDLTGAAEMAGAGVRHGLATRLLRHQVGHCDDGLCVVDADSRSLSVAAAVELHSRIASSLRRETFDLIYKKTDSALRGHITAELDALMRTLGIPRSILLPQNPSRGRVIRGGEYLIDGIPLHQTEFAQDPDFPARTSGILKVLESSVHAVRLIRPDDTGELPGIAVAEAENPQDINSFTKRICLDCLPAGGVDFFTAILRERGLMPVVPPPVQKLDGRVMILCGSTSAYSRKLSEIVRRHEFDVCPMPEKVFLGAAGSEWVAWADEICAKLSATNRVLVTVSQHVEPQRAGWLLQALASVAQTVLTRIRLDHLLLAGGATAATVADRMGWSEFSVASELATGVVRLRPLGGVPLLTIKPGSYRWPDELW